MAVIRSRFVAAEEYAGSRDIVWHREGFGLCLAASAAFKRHHVEELVRCRACIIAAQLVHRRKH